MSETVHKVIAQPLTIRCFRRDFCRKDVLKRLEWHSGNRGIT